MKTFAIIRSLALSTAEIVSRLINAQQKINLQLLILNEAFHFNANMAKNLDPHFKCEYFRVFLVFYYSELNSFGFQTDNRLSHFYAEISRINWFQLLKCEYFCLFKRFLKF